MGGSHRKHKNRGGDRRHNKGDNNNNNNNNNNNSTATTVYAETADYHNYDGVSSANSSEGGGNHGDNNSTHSANSWAGSNNYGGDNSSSSQFADFTKVLQEVEGSAFRVTWKELIWLVVCILMLAALSIFMGVAAGITISIHYFDNNNNPTAASAAAGGAWGGNNLPQAAAGGRGGGGMNSLGGSAGNPANDAMASVYQQFNSQVAAGNGGGGNVGHNGRGNVLHRTTTLDPNILSQNIILPDSSNDDGNNQNKNKLDLGRVITTTQTGQRNVLLVVEEALQEAYSNLHNQQHDQQDQSSGATAEATAAGWNQNHYNALRSSSGGVTGKKSSTVLSAESYTSTLSRSGLVGKSYHEIKGQYHQGPPNLGVSPIKILPKLCKDGLTTGFQDWDTLKAAIEEANALSAERFMKWNEYFASLDDDDDDVMDYDPYYDDDYGQLDNNNLALSNNGDGHRDTNNDSPGSISNKKPSSGHSSINRNHRKKQNRFLDPAHYYEEDVIFTICPGSILSARRGPIYINAENVVIECGEDDGDYDYYDFYDYFGDVDQDDTSHDEDYERYYYHNLFKSADNMNNQQGTQCVIDVGGTHLSFGPHAKNVVVRGITFKRAHTSSLAFHYDGAQAHFEDCTWIDNTGVHGKYGAVADVNSTSTVDFARCEITFAGTSATAGAGATTMFPTTIQQAAGLDANGNPIMTAQPPPPGVLDPNNPNNNNAAVNNEGQNNNNLMNGGENGVPTNGAPNNGGAPNNAGGGGGSVNMMAGSGSMPYANNQNQFTPQQQQYYHHQQYMHEQYHQQVNNGFASYVSIRA